MPVIGCCNSPPNLVVISQFSPVGSLYQVLHEGNGGGSGLVVDSARAIQFALDVARGMAYLHSLDREMPRFHLNSKHVMVGASSFHSCCRWLASDAHTQQSLFRQCLLVQSFQCPLLPELYQAD